MGAANCASHYHCSRKVTQSAKSVPVVDSSLPITSGTGMTRIQGASHA